MSQESADATTSQAARLAGGAVAGLKFLATDRFGLIILVWALIAFGLRPLMLDAHGGAAGGIYDAIRGAFDVRGLARVTAMAQWIPFVMAVVLAVMGHVRFGAGASPRGSFWIAAGYAGLFAAGYVAFLWSPASVFTLITHDSFIFFDSTYRIAHGETPSTDFHTAIGAASFYLPAFGAWLAGGYAGSVELASAFVALGLGLACAQAGASRFPHVVTLVLVGMVFLIAVPAALLEDWSSESLTVVDGQTEVLVDNLTWAMFYNRWGWAALIPVFMWLAPRKDKAAPNTAETIAFAAVLVFLFWLKVSYFVVGLGAAAIYAWQNARPVRTLLVGLGATLAGVLAIGLLTGNLFAYVGDILMAGKISGGRADALLGLVRKNLIDMLLAAAPLALLAALGKFTWRDLAVAGFMVAGSLFAINQNGQLANMISLIVVAAYGVARVWDVAQTEAAKAGRMTRFAAMGSFVMLAAGPVFDRGMLLMDQAYAIKREELRPATAWSAIPAMKGIHIPERESFFDRISEGATPEARRKQLWLSGIVKRRQELRQGEYMETVVAGLADLRGVVKPGESVVTLDMVNPFEFMLETRPAKGAYLTLHKERTISATVHPASEVMFADADHVMIAKMSMVQATADLMSETYAGWLDAHYGEKVETDYWTRWSKKK